jgi:hypothetical protein
MDGIALASVPNPIPENGPQSEFSQPQGETEKWSPRTQAGADVMKRIAAQMIGGVVTSAILVLLIYPVIFIIWRRRSLPKEGRHEHPEPIASESAPVTARPRPSFARFVVTPLPLQRLGIGEYYGWADVQWKDCGLHGGGRHRDSYADLPEQPPPRVYSHQTESH